MHKVGVVTYYNAINNGAFLQAYAMQTFLESEGFSVSFIPIIDFVEPNVKSIEGKQFYNLYIEKLQKMLCNLHVVNMNHASFDSIIYGSDEIWNLRNKGLSPYLWGYHLRSHNKVSYASCIGNSKIMDFCLFPYTIWGLRKFSHLSVRDDYSKRIIAKLSSKNVSKVLDPTFLISYTQFKKNNIYGKYILVYSYGLKPNTIEKIKEIAKQKNCRVIYTGAYCNWSDKNIPADPFEWIALIYNAEYVFTSTFHGTVFSIICNKQFSVVDTNSEKVLGILKDTGLLSRKIEIGHKFIPDEIINYQVVMENINSLIKISKEYLVSCLNKF